MASRYIPNDFSPLFALAPDEPDRHLQQALEDIVAQRPPRDDYSDDRLSGLWSGPTGFAYLFLHVARRRPQLLVAGEPARAWAERYMAGTRTADQLSLDLAARVGINCEALAASAVRACLAQDLRHVRAFVARVPEIVATGGGAERDAAPTPDEMLQGRAGTLYMLRLMRAWVAGAAELVDEPIRSVSQAILAAGPGWTWHGRRYLGAVHGDVGIVAQLVLATPSLAARLEDAMARLLDAQLPSGNWPIVEPEPEQEQQPGKSSSSRGDDGGYTLVQFCHGVTGFLPSLLALRPYFPSLAQRIDEAVEKGRQCIWREGLLVKEPSICHGIFGSALALPRGPQRDHFLGATTPERTEAIAAKVEDETKLFEPADYGRTYPTVSGGLWSAAWTWMVCGEDEPGFAFYTDV